MINLQTFDPHQDFVSSVMLTKQISDAELFQ